MSRTVQLHTGNQTLIINASTASFATTASYTNPVGLPSGTVSSSTQLPTGILSSSAQINNYNIFATTGSNTFLGSQTASGSLNIRASTNDQDPILQISEFRGTALTKFYESQDAGILTVGYYGLTGTRTEINGGSSNTYTSMVMYQGTTAQVFLASTGSSYINGGNVGIGTTTPTNYAGYQTLAINSATNGGLLEIQKAGTVIGYMNGASGMLLLANSGNDLQLTTAGANNIILRTNATDRVVINSSGNVGMGITNPSYRLEVSGSISANQENSVAGTYNTIAYYFSEGRGWGYNSADDSVFYNAAAGELPFRASRTTVVVNESANDNDFRVEGTTDQNLLFTDASANKVGISTASPLYTLDVNGVYGVGGRPFATGSSVYNMLYRPDAGIGIYLGGSDASNYYDNSGHHFRDRSGNTRMYIAASTTGNVGIGTTSPTSSLHVVGTITAGTTNTSGRINFGTGDTGVGIYRDNTYDLVIQQHESSGNTLYLVGAGDVRVSIDSNDNQTNSKFIIGNNAIKASNELFSVNEFGSGYFSGSVGIGTTSPGATLHVQGNVSASSYTGSLLSTNGVVSSSTASSPSQGTVRVTINGVNTDVDTGLQTGDSPSFVTITSTQATGTAPLTVASRTLVTNLNADLLDGLDSTSFAITGSNTFTANQTISGSLTITQNLNVLGSSSISYVSQSTLNIGTNLVTVNVQNPSIRFGGLAVIDSGSSPQRSGSLLFDSVNDQWIFVHQNQTSPTSSVVLMGPQTFNNIGNETNLTNNYLLKSTNAEHVGDSQLFDNGTNVGIGTASPGAKLHVQGNVSASSYTGSLLSTNGIVSSSGQVSYLGLSSIPSGIVSGSTASSPSQGTVRVTINGANTDVDTGLQTGDSPSFTGLTVDTNTLYVDATNDRVGMGTVSPAYGLAVNNASTSNTGTVYINAVLNSSGKGLVIDSTTRTTADNNVLALEIINRAGGNTIAATVAGNVGIGTTSPTRTLTVNGSANITGSLDVTGAFTAQTKSFKIDHQMQPGKSLVYGVLEGPEHAVYVRGRLTNNNTIILPPEWDWLVDSTSITVQLTPIGSHQKLYVEKILNNVIFIRNENVLNTTIDCYYLVHATRKDVEPLQTVQ